MIPSNVRAAYEATDHALHRLLCLHTALQALTDQPDALRSPSAESDALLALLAEAETKLREIGRLRNSEWQAINLAVCK